MEQFDLFRAHLFLVFSTTVCDAASSIKAATSFGLET